MHHKDAFLDQIIKASMPDLAEALSICVNPAEADMLFTLGLYETYKNAIPKRFLENRYDYNQPWHLFDKVFELISENKTLSEHLSCTIIALYESNLFSLSHNANHITAPYHPSADQLPPLFLNDGSIVTLKNAEFIGIINKAANLNKHYKEFTNNQELIYEFKSLNMREDPMVARKCRLDALTEVKYISQHATSCELNGQRGVFAKTIIPCGTVLGYVTGDVRKLGDPTPPILCSWPIASYRFKIGFNLARHFVHTYTQWIDSYIIGNRLKLVNSCIPHFKGYKPIDTNHAPHEGNIGCYFGHFVLSNEKPKYVTLPFYIALRDISLGEELMTFYGC